MKIAANIGYSKIQAIGITIYINETIFYQETMDEGCWEILLKIKLRPKKINKILKLETSLKKSCSVQ